MISGQRHEVDIPVTDDLEDDEMFDTELNNGYYYGRTGNQSTVNKFFQKINDYFKSPNQDVEFELFDSTGSRNSFEIDEVTLENQYQFRDYKIELLKKRIKVIVVVSALIIGGLFAVIINMLGLVIGSKSDKQPGLSYQLSKNNSTHFNPTTIVVSLDGFHPHYINKEDTPSMHEMMVSDFGAPYMIPSFPSSTFPNHWTLVTGLFPSEHGIVGNTFFDPKLNKQFINTNPSVGGLDPDFWSGGEPIWETASKQGVKSAVHMWPGSEVPGVGIGNGPLYVDRYNGSELLSSKVDRVMEWLDQDIENRPELILTYVPTIDQYGHKLGIAGPELTKALKYVDDFVAYLKQEIDRRGLNDIVNLIIVSDHGMAPTSNERLLYLDDIIDLDHIEHIDGWPLFGLRPKDEFSNEEILNNLRNSLNKLDDETRDNFKVYSIDEIPPEWNFGGKLDDHKFNYRLAPIWIIPNVGYSVTTHEQMKANNFDYKPKGVHGYNNTHLLMRAIFLGSGPYFEKKLATGKKVLPFNNTEVYNIICESLSLVPAPNNGTDLTTGSVISQEQSLPKDWNDILDFPDLPYFIEHIVHNATYDELWRADEKGPTLSSLVSTNDNAFSSLILQESSKTLITENLPKPTDFKSTFISSSGKPVPTTGAGSFNDILGDIGEGLGDLANNIEDSVGEIIQDAGDSIGDLLLGAEDFVGNIFHKGSGN